MAYYPDSINDIRNPAAGGGNIFVQMDGYHQRALTVLFNSHSTHSWKSSQTRGMLPFDLQNVFFIVHNAESYHHARLTPRA